MWIGENITEQQLSWIIYSKAGSKNWIYARKWSHTKKRKQQNYGKEGSWEYRELALKFGHFESSIDVFTCWDLGRLDVQWFREHRDRCFNPRGSAIHPKNKKPPERHRQRLQRAATGPRIFSQRDTRFTSAVFKLAIRGLFLYMPLWNLWTHVTTVHDKSSLSRSLIDMPTLHVPQNCVFSHELVVDSRF